VLRRAKEAIVQIEATETLRELPNVTKLNGAGVFYRLRAGDNRIGIAVEGEQVKFVGRLHRRAVYRQFP
jgi:mRNA interferase RelE/StbE